MQITATIGPASRYLISALRGAGAASFRLNASHLTVEDLGLLASAVREEAPDAPLVVDLQGAKMRLGWFVDRAVHSGEAVAFSQDGRKGTVPLPHREIYEAVQAGDTLGCDDDRLRFRVISASNDVLDSVALSNGILRPRKGVNILEHPLDLDRLTEVDLACIGATMRIGGVSFAFSFMKDGRETAWIRSHAPDCGVVGKIERREAAENVGGIAGSVDALWICRGDLGAQLGRPGMARWVSAYDPRVAPCPVFMAGQVMEHLTSHSNPTRSEVCHLFDLSARGYAGIVLSDETAIGHDPVGAVQRTCSLISAFAE